MGSARIEASDGEVRQQINSLPNLSLLEQSVLRSVSFTLGGVGSALGYPTSAEHQGSHAEILAVNRDHLFGKFGDLLEKGVFTFFFACELCLHDILLYRFVWLLFEDLVREGDDGRTAKRIAHRKMATIP